MNDMQIFKANLKAELQLIAALLFAILIFFPLFSRVPTIAWIILLVLYASLLFANLLFSRLNEIHVDDTKMELTLIYRNYFRTVKSTSYNLKEIKFTYKRKATSIRSGIKNVCSLYFQDKMIVDIIPDNDGWDNSEVHAFVGNYWI
jgi:hypothetical protein